MFADWWRNDSFLVPTIAEKYYELRIEGMLIGDEEDDNSADFASVDFGILEQPGDQDVRVQIGVLAAEAERAMPGLGLTPDSIEEAEEVWEREAA